MSTDIWVLSYEHLKGRPRSDQALILLQKIASRVKPIMRKHGWRLPVLAEFFPDNPGLIGLNINMGQKILLRLRPAWAPDTFYPEEDIIETMLHELTHNVHGPHDQTFYNFLSGLQEEYYELKRSGYAGEGFFTNGRRLGGGMIPQTVPAMIAQQRSIELEFIERKRRANTVSGTNGPVRLGGGNLASLGLTPRELAVLAADMRAADEKKCVSGARAQQEADKAARESHHSNAIDLTGDFDFSEDLIILDDGLSGSTSNRASRPANSQTSSHHKQPLRSQSEVIQPTRTPPSVNVLTKPRPPPIKNVSKPSAEPPWTCPSCTLINQPVALQCDACLAVRPIQHDEQVAGPATPAGWTCGVCGEEGMEHNLWICRFCGNVKTESTFG